MSEVLASESKITPTSDASAVFGFFKENAIKLPLLAALAMKYLCSPCTSVDCERLLSQVGLLLANNCRGRLSDSTIEKIVAVKNYLLEIKGVDIELLDNHEFVRLEV